MHFYNDEVEIALQWLTQSSCFHPWRQNFLTRTIVGLVKFLIVFLRNVDHGLLRSWFAKSEQACKAAQRLVGGVGVGCCGDLGGMMKLKTSKEEAEISKNDRRKKYTVTQHFTGKHRNSSYSCTDWEYFSQTTALCYVTNSCILLINHGGTVAKWDTSRSTETLRTCRISASYVTICLTTDFVGFKWNQLADTK
jgi:hypothetical protein